jgi:uncharacterized protein (TIGR02118 family)
MTVSYFVRYQGQADDPDAFLRHYREAHAPILHQFPGLRELVLHRGVDWRDPFPVTPGGTLLLAQMTFETIDDLDRALVSEARARARDDFARMPAFHGAITHQAMVAEPVPS